MTEIEQRGNLPPRKVAPSEGYKEMRVCFLSSGTEMLDNRSGYVMTSVDKGIIDYIKRKLAYKRIDDSLKGYTKVRRTL